MSEAVPGGLSESAFKATVVDCTSWLWGTVQGAFNQKASLSQIIVDAVIGMVPLLGDVTAVRDIIAVTIRLVDDPKAREDKWEWVLLVVLVIALIPVVGGAIKGVGRLTIRAGRALEGLVGAARTAYLAETAKDIVAFLNRIGAGHAEQWILKLRFADYEAQVAQKFDELLYVINGALVKIEDKLGKLLSSSMRARIEGLMNGIGQIRKLAREMIPQAFKDLDNTLREIQTYIRSGGQTTSRTAEHAVTAGDAATRTMTDELRLLEGQSAVRSARGGWEQNPGFRDQFEKRGLYKHEPGYPDLLARADKKEVNGKSLDWFPNIASFTGRAVNRPLAKGEQIYRAFGPSGVTHWQDIATSAGAGNPKYKAAFWGLGKPPANAEEWRKGSAVLDEWNRNGFIVVGTLQTEGAVKAVTGKIAEQTGSKIAGQYLPGGGVQAMVETEAKYINLINESAQRVISSGKTETFRAGDMVWEVRPTNWKDVNGVHGYDLVTAQAGVQTSRLGAREEATKREREAAASLAPAH